jgi:hypothetical protein
MAAREDQAQPVVAHDILLGHFVAGVQKRGLGLSVFTQRLSPKPIDGAVAGRRDDPSHGAGGQPGGGPSQHGRRERVLNRLLGDIDVAEVADQHGHGAAVVLAEEARDLIDGRRAVHQCWSWNGRTSMGRTPIA